MANNDHRPADPKWRPETQLVHGGTLRSQFGETSEALFLTQGFVYTSAEQAEARFKGEDPGFQYSRFGNPTVAMFEERIRLLEGAEEAARPPPAWPPSPPSLLSYLKAGDHIVAARALFGSCRYIVETLCPRFGITVDARRRHRPRRLAHRDPPQHQDVLLRDAVQPDTSSSSTSRRSRRSPTSTASSTIVDNVFATPMLQRPLAHGADIVVYSATKHIDGQGRCLGGAVLGSKDFVTKHLQELLRQTGPSLSPFNAWVMLKGLETMPVRVKAQSATAARIADHLAGRQASTACSIAGAPTIHRPTLPAKQMTGGGQMIAFEVEGGKAGRFPLPERAASDHHFQQSGRCQKPRHASGHDHAFQLTEPSSAPSSALVMV